jgi:hypothetical protein
MCKEYQAKCYLIWCKNQFLIEQKYLYIEQISFFTEQKSILIEHLI